MSLFDIFKNKEVESESSQSESQEEIIQEEKQDIPQERVDLAEEMQNARKEKNWAVADAARAKLTELGYVVKNTPTGYELTKK